MLGEDLRSQEVALPVPSALAGLTAGFEMGPGVPPPLATPSNPCPPQTGGGLDCPRCIVRSLLCSARQRDWLSRRDLRSEEKPSTISTAWLHPLQGLHLPPIEPVVCRRSYSLSG